MTTGWTKEEVEAELRRRSDAQREFDRNWQDAARKAELANADANCIHCGRPFRMALAAGGEWGFCDECAGD